MLYLFIYNFVHLVYVFLHRLLTFELYRLLIIYVTHAEFFQRFSCIPVRYLSPFFALMRLTHFMFIYSILDFCYFNISTVYYLS